MKYFSQCFFRSVWSVILNVSILFLYLNNGLGANEEIAFQIPLEHLDFDTRNYCLEKFQPTLRATWRHVSQYLIPQISEKQKPWNDLTKMILTKCLHLLINDLPKTIQRETKTILIEGKKCSDSLKSNVLFIKSIMCDTGPIVNKEMDNLNF